MSAHAGIDDLKDICSYLQPLDRTAVINLGMVLGLDYHRLKTMMDTPTFLEEMVAWWLQRVDRVELTGVPRWKRLAVALRDPRVGQNRVALSIKLDKLHGTYIIHHTYSLFGSLHSIYDTILKY